MQHFIHFPSNSSSAFCWIFARSGWFGGKREHTLVETRWKAVACSAACDHIPASLLTDGAFSCCSVCEGFLLLYPNLSFESAWVCVSVHTHTHSVDRRTVRPLPVHFHLQCTSAEQEKTIWSYFRNPLNTWYKWPDSLWNTVTYYCDSATSEHACI